MFVVLVIKPKCGFQTYARLGMTTKATKFNKPKHYNEISKFPVFYNSKTVFGIVELRKSFIEICVPAHKTPLNFGFTNIPSLYQNRLRKKFGNNNA